MIGHVVRQNFPAAKKISRILSPQIAVRSEVCLAHLLDYFGTKFSELTPTCKPTGKRWSRGSGVVPRSQCSGQDTRGAQVEGESVAEDAH